MVEIQCSTARLQKAAKEAQVEQLLPLLAAQRTLALVVSWGPLSQALPEAQALFQEHLLDQAQARQSDFCQPLVAVVVALATLTCRELADLEAKREPRLWVLLTAEPREQSLAVLTLTAVMEPLLDLLVLVEAAEVLLGMAATAADTVLVEAAEVLE